MRLNLKKNLKLINWYFPYLGAGISVKNVNDSFTSIDVQMKMRWWNRNLVGTHFGGSLYSMCDPFYMFILIQNLGKNYIVWDKAASIQFKKPGLGNVYANFTITEEKIAEIKQYVDANTKGDFIFNCTVLNDKNEIIAEVEKVLYVRKK